MIYFRFFDLIIIFTLIIFLYHLLFYFLKDRKHIKAVNQLSDPKSIILNSLKDSPLVNIVIPAWKEGESFKHCLNSVDQLKYPKLKVIINAGGSKETKEIAESYKESERFTVIFQKSGEGKLKAINDCLKYISNGIICIIDADIILNDKILLALIYPLVNDNEDIVFAPLTPHSSIINNDLVNYSYINRNRKFKRKFTRYTYGFASNACIKYNVIEAIGKFSEKRLRDDAVTTGMDLKSKGFKSFRIIDYKIQCLTYPTTIKEYFNQNLRWIENFLYSSVKNQKIKIIKFIAIVFLSILFLSFPIFLFYNLYFFLIGILFFYSLYLKRIRRIIFAKLTNEKINIKIAFFIKLIFYIFLDILTNVIVFLEILFYRKAYKKRKNIFFEKNLTHNLKNNF